jgi:release factor glutamine methyltransferase
MTLEQALAWGKELLARSGVEEPGIDAEVLLSQATGLNRAGLFTWHDRELTPKQLARFRADLYRRAEREPLAYITGQREFFGLSFAVSPAVLIPRPETELLVEEVLRWCARPSAPAAPLLVDVGTGSGIIAVTVAVHLPGARILATDASTEALDVARANAAHHGVAGRIDFLLGDLLAGLSEPVDLIAANLPYVATPDWEALMPEIREYEPRQALDGGPDGLEMIRGLLSQAPRHLRPGAAVLVEIGAMQGAQATTLARSHLPAAQIEIQKDYAGLDRLLLIHA